MNIEPMYVASSWLLSLASLGCAATYPISPADRRAPDPLAHVHRLDFVVTSGEAGAPPTVKEQFTLNLADRQHGDISVGRNVPLQGGSLSGTGSSRTDVGLRLGADCTSTGDDVMLQLRLDVSETEAAAAGAPVPIHKASASGDVLIKPGQPAVALRLDDGHRQYDVNVTATRLR